MGMNYPTIAEVVKADREHVFRWWKMLPRPENERVDFQEVPLFGRFSSQTRWRDSVLASNLRRFHPLV